VDKGKYSWIGWQLSDKGKILSDKPEILSVEKYPSK
jgi:hypothetical protein